MDSLLNLVKDYAPTLATALGGPMAGAAVSAIAKQFGVEDNVDAVTNALKTASPEQLARLEEIKVEELKAHNANTADARNMNTQLQLASGASWVAKNTGYVLDYIIVLATMLMTYRLFGSGVPPENKELAYMAFGSLLTLCGTVVNFHRGSSKGSQDKTELMKGMK
jgi:hypothetical protein